MEQRFYKIRLRNGRVIGPIDLERVKLFLLKDQITGLEMARLYPTGDWKDINTYPEIAELLVQKLEGKLVGASGAPLDASSETYDLKRDEKEQDLPSPSATMTGTPALQEITNASPRQASESSAVSASAQTLPDGSATVLIERPEAESTIFYTKEDQDKSVEHARRAEAEEPELDTFRVSSEKTVMLELKSRPESSAKKKKFMAVVALVLLVGLFFGSEKEKEPVEPPFIVEMPAAKAVADPQKSEKAFAVGLPFYVQDTVEGYKKAARAFLEAVAYSPDNVRALCLLASSYMNLIEVVNRDENYFNVVTRIIELERAKDVDLGETVVADVELYHTLGNPDAAITRIIEFSRTHQWGVEMLYYLGMSFFLKGKSPDALAQLNKIDPKDYFSPKINVLYGLIYMKNGQIDEALKAFQQAVDRSPRHAKARAKLAELYFSKDNLPEASKNAEFVISNPSSASKSELARSYYIRAKINLVNRREPEALSDIETALKLSPDDQDVVLDYYTIKAKFGAEVSDPSGKAKMFHFMAEGERASRGGDLDGALAQFLNAREARYDDSAPLLKVAEIFEKKGDLQSAKSSLAKAIALDRKKAELYPRYVKLLIDAYELEDASKALTAYKELNPPSSTVDRLQGDYYFKQDKLHEALAYYKRALASSNVDSRVYVAYASLMFKSGNYRDAAFYYGLARRFDPFNVDATIGIGKSIAELEGIEAGVQYVQNALESSPHKAALLNGLAEIYERKGDHAAAIKFADNALTTDSSFALAHKTRGDAFVSLDKKKEALDAYLTYTNMAPLDPTGHVARYKIYLKKLDLKAAKSQIQKVIDNYPKYPGAYYMLGDLYREGQNYQAALDAALIEIKHNPGYVQAYVLAGTAYNLLKDYSSALAVLNKGLKLAPDYVPVLIQAGFANHNLKTYAAAQSMFERALKLDPGNPQIHKRLGSLYHDLGQRERAKQHFKAYLDLYPDAPDRKDMDAYVNQ